MSLVNNKIEQEIFIEKMTNKEYFEKVATKRYQSAKLRRIATHIVLNISSEDVLSIYKLKNLGVSRGFFI